ncbi:atrial natriuretic peptide-converting enzyme-like [Dreissena polymorpha]|uniref:atrial natriuretic peptide-converting enzyme-like n=1 Tax=Dreissena polymorpha TaxID=45954 RepID=UPI0022651274|nr:atrial natriuretic peptide-converting enzyme-like [Dreissena polymorpha]XP_052279791.1 atrial natriuretic peptide-converting enzyme-like [Dreissena polymorpha]
MEHYNESSVNLLSVKRMNGNHPPLNNNLDKDIEKSSENNNVLSVNKLYELESFTPEDLSENSDLSNLRCKRWFYLCAGVVIMFMIVLIVGIIVFFKLSAPDSHKLMNRTTTEVPPYTSSASTVPSSTTELSSFSSTSSSPTWSTTSVSTDTSSVTSSSTLPSSLSSTSTSSVLTTTSSVSSSSITINTTESLTTFSTSPISVCEHSEFRCADGSCIRAQYVCDGRPHCPGADDEYKNCKCSADQFQCASGQCISSNFRCDKVAQCDDLSDEINCTNCSGFQCNSGLCLWTTSVQCNNHIDCLDLSDELNCMLRPGYLRCANNLTVPRDSFCNHRDDCFDNSDETDPDCKYEECGIHEIMCDDELSCYLRDWKCDGYTDCHDQSDEKYCGICKSGEFKCSNHKCIPANQVCDGIEQCSMGTDEMRCLHLSSDLSGTLAVTSGDLQLPVCSDTWSETMATEVCSQLGLGPSTGSSSISPVTAGVSTNQGFMVASPDPRTLNHNQTVLSRLDKAVACPSNKVVQMGCQQKGCGERQIDVLTPFIVGGTLAPQGKWPWIVSLIMKGTNICGGVLIGDKWALTAAHCIVHQDANYTLMPHVFEVLAGTTSRERLSKQPFQRVRVEKIYLNPSMRRLENGQIDWDMALLKLSSAVKFGDFVQPICLPEISAPVPTNLQCFLAGWGYINTKSVMVTDLREAKMRLYNDDFCSKNINQQSLETHVNTNSTLCSGYTHGQISGCQGDSGSPLMCQDSTGHWTVQGLMSYGVDGCDGQFKSIVNRFAKVSTSVNWIQSIISINLFVT